MKEKLLKFLKEKKIILLVVGIVLILLICLLGVTRCTKDPLRGKDHLEDIYFEKPEGEETTDSGVIGEAKYNWNSVKYSADDIIFTITHYEKRSVQYGVLISEEGLKEKKINGVVYYYAKTKIDDTHFISRYYTQVGEDTYYVSVVSTKNDTNEKKIDDFVNSIVFKK